MDNQVVNNAEYFDKLFDFFNKDTVNPFLATFVCRVASCYLLVKPKEVRVNGLLINNVKTLILTGSFKDDHLHEKQDWFY